MEHQARYNLDAALENWRTELAAQPNLTAEVRRELETHLRDTLAGFRQRGLSDEEAFWLARRRLGQPQELGPEFTKADPLGVWRERLSWMVLAILVLKLWNASGWFLCIAIIYIGDCLGNSICHAAGNGSGLLFDNLYLQTAVTWLPLLACVCLLAYGRLNLARPGMPKFFRSRFRLAAAAALWIIANCSLHLLHQLPPLLANLRLANASAVSQSWHRLWVGLFDLTVSPLLLVALLIWLKAPENKKSLQTA